MSQEPGSAVVDTVVLHYFLLARRCDLLASLIGAPLLVPRIVFDPDEGSVPVSVRSEITRGIEVLSRNAANAHQPEESRRAAALKAQRLREVADLHEQGSIHVLDLTVTERALAGRLNSGDHLAQFQLRFPLGMGEAACVAIALERGYVLVTDDSAALEVFLRLQPGGQHARIRGLLRMAAEAGTVTQTEANAIHTEMTTLGFWDRMLPFPPSDRS